MENCKMNPSCRRQTASMPSHMLSKPVAMAYVPWQTYTETFDLCKSLRVGTIFPELCLPFCGMRRKCR